MAAKIFDVAVVGAGPAGSACAFYLAQAGLEVLLLEKERFPRDKICGEAVCSPAFPHLRQMGVLQQVLDSGQGHWSRRGGFLSPGGIKVVETSAETEAESLVIAIKRTVLDELMARAAARAGAELVDGWPVQGARLSAGDDAWSIRRADGASFRARALVAADGANSRLARSLGVLSGPPQAICSRAHVAPGSHRFPLDGMVYYPRELLPGYAAVFREAADELNFCCYIIPGGHYQLGDLRRVHHELLARGSLVRQDVGPDARFESFKAAPLRLGGVPRSYDERFLMVGDAAGQIDPLTGEGIHYGIEGGRIAADTLAQAFAAGSDLGRPFLARYHWRWMQAFGNDFFWSARMARMVDRVPALLDAYADISLRRGGSFMLQWARIMTGARPKYHLLAPTLALPIALATARRTLA
jgi:geranylgeranyl reductase family protein